MSRRVTASLLISVCLAVVPHRLLSSDLRSAQPEDRGTIQGTVQSSAGEALGYANVVLVGTEFGTMTENDGTFRIARIPPGEYELRVSYLLFEPESQTIQVAAGETTTAQFILDPAPVPVIKPGILDLDLRYHIHEADEATIVLLDSREIINDPQWRDHYSGQILGFGIRTPRKEISQDDLRRIKRCLLEPTSYEAWNGGRGCGGGIVALLMRSRIGEVLVMINRCDRVQIRVETLACLSFLGRLTAPASAEFLEIARTYFKQDVYLEELAASRTEVPADTDPLFQWPIPRERVAAQNPTGSDGLVMIQMTIDKEGRVLDASVVNSVGSVDMEEAAKKAAMHWRFEPGKVRGMPIETKMVFPFEFGGTEP